MSSTKIVLSVVALAIFASAPAATASRSPRVERTVVEEYNAPAPGVHTPVPYALVEAGCYQDLPEGCVRFESKPGERYLSLEIDDLVSDNIFVWVDPGSGEYVAFCGLKTPKPLKIHGGGEVKVFLLEGTCGQGAGYAPSAVTRGTVTATFSNRA